MMMEMMNRIKGIAMFGAIIFTSNESFGRLFIVGT